MICRRFNAFRSDSLEPLGLPLHHAGLLDPLALLGHIQRLEDGLGPLPAVHIRVHEAGPYARKVNKVRAFDDREREFVQGPSRHRP